MFHVGIEGLELFCGQEFADFSEAVDELGSGLSEFTDLGHQALESIAVLKLPGVAGLGHEVAEGLFIGLTPGFEFSAESGSDLHDLTTLGVVEVDATEEFAEHLSSLGLSGSRGRHAGLTAGPAAVAEAIATLGSRAGGTKLVATRPSAVTHTATIAAGWGHKALLATGLSLHATAAVTRIAEGLSTGSARGRRHELVAAVGAGHLGVMSWGVLAHALSGTWLSEGWDNGDASEAYSDGGESCDEKVTGSREFHGQVLSLMGE